MHWDWLAGRPIVEEPQKRGQLDISSDERRR